MATTKHDGAPRVVVTVNGNASYIYAETPAVTIQEQRGKAEWRAAQIKRSNPHARVGIIEWTPLPAGSPATVTL